MVCVILVAEDEVMIRNIVRQSLESDGHRVMAAADGAEALELSRKFGGQIDLLITDLTMPRMSGFDLIRQILSDRPDLRILVISGLPLSESGDSLLRFPLLQKPFNPIVLRNKVREILYEHPCSG